MSAPKWEASERQICSLGANDIGLGNVCVGHGRMIKSIWGEPTLSGLRFQHLLVGRNMMSQVEHAQTRRNRASGIQSNQDSRGASIAKPDPARRCDQMRKVGTVAPEGRTHPHFAKYRCKAKTKGGQSAAEQVIEFETVSAAPYKDSLASYCLWREVRKATQERVGILKSNGVELRVLQGGKLRLS